MILLLLYSYLTQFETLTAIHFHWLGKTYHKPELSAAAAAAEVSNEFSRFVLVSTQQFNIWKENLIYFNYHKM